MGYPVTDRAKSDEEPTIQHLKAAVTLGFSFVATAMAYTKGEERIGKAVALGFIRRHTLNLAIKAGERFGEVTGSVDDCSYAGVKCSVADGRGFVPLI